MPGIDETNSPPTASDPPFEIIVKSKKTGDDPPLEYYHVTLKNKLGIWTETMGSRQDLVKFLRGVEAGAGMCGHLAIWCELPWPG